MTHAVAVRALVERYGDQPSSSLVLCTDKQYFSSAQTEGIVAYNTYGNYIFQYGNVIAPNNQKAALLLNFREFARQQGKRICAVQIGAQDVPFYTDEGFKVNQFGCTYSLDLNEFQVSGAVYRNIRNKIRRAERQGVDVAEIGVDLPRSETLLAELNDLTSSWLHLKGRRKKLMKFMVGELEVDDNTPQRIFVSLIKGRIVGFITYLPTYGKLTGYLHDLSRRGPDGPPGIMELTNFTALSRFQSEGIRYLHFGVAPCVGIDSHWDNSQTRSSALAWALSTIANHGQIIYRAKSQAKYKMKWRPQIVEPEFVAFEGRFRPSMIWSFLRLARAL